MKQVLLKILKGFIYVIILAATVGFIYHFIRGIYCSLFADDVITAQNRIDSAYQFLYMAGAGTVLVLALYSTRLVKVYVLPETWRNKIKSLFTKKKEAE
jgi:hypothetical protein